MALFLIRLSFSYDLAPESKNKLRLALAAKHIHSIIRAGDGRFYDLLSDQFTLESQSSASSIVDLVMSEVAELDPRPAVLVIRADEWSARGLKPHVAARELF
jgi:hypothetical protein